MTHQTCAISGEVFEVSDLEKSLRAKFGFGDTLPTVAPKYRFRELGAFWPHWNLHPRKCDKTGKSIISIFRPDCPYPVWHRDTWIEKNDPPQAEFDFDRPFFDQAWELFQRCPLPHTFQGHNQNCEYADDLWHSKNCYLVHSSENCEDVRWSMYCSDMKQCYFCAYNYFCELCTDTISSYRCYHLIYGVRCRNVRDSAFLYDCRGCSDCMFCFNLRNKKYCFGNQQLTQEAFEAKKKEWDLRSRKTYQKAQQFFADMMHTKAYHRALFVDKCEGCEGNYLDHCNQCENCYLVDRHDGNVNVCVSGPDAKSCLDSLGTIGGELGFYSVMATFCYESRFLFECNECRFCDYSAYCRQCKDCFGCCGLYKKQYCIFNKQYSKDEYESLKKKIIDHIKAGDQWGKIFPGHFAPNPYDESCSGFFFPLDPSEQEALGFRYQPPYERVKKDYLNPSEIPDSFAEASEDLFSQTFWDEQAKRPFQIQPSDIDIARERGFPPPDKYYMRRIQEHFQWIPWNGELRETKCAKSGVKIHTSWGEEYDGRILCEEEYLKIVV